MAARFFASSKQWNAFFKFHQMLDKTAALWDVTQGPLIDIWSVGYWPTRDEPRPPFRQSPKSSRTLRGWLFSGKLKQEKKSWHSINLYSSTCRRDLSEHDHSWLLPPPKNGFEKSPSLVRLISENGIKGQRFRCGSGLLLFLWPNISRGRARARIPKSLEIFPEGHSEVNPYK